MLWALLFACYDPVTNAPLYEDALFLEALPAPAMLRPPSVSSDGSSAALLQATQVAAGDLDTVVEPVLRAAEALRGVQPSERSSRHRVFPPTPVVAVDVLDPTEAWWVRATIIEPQLDVFSWTIEVAPSADGPWEVAGDGLSTPEQGSLTWDYDAATAGTFTGNVQADWSNTSEPRETTFAVSLDAAPPIHFGLYGDSAISFMFSDVDLGDEPVSGAALTLLGDAGGRSDSLLDDGRIVAECWNAQGQRVYLAVGETVSGSAADCALEQVIDPADWAE